MPETTQFLLLPRGFPCTSSLRHNPSRLPTSHVINSFNAPKHHSPTMFFPRNRRLHLQLPKNSSFDGNNLTGRNSDVLRRSPSTKSNFVVCALPKDSYTSYNDRGTIISSLISISLAVANRVLYKLALVPMKEFPFFLAQFTTFGYVVIYFSILYMRYAAGMVTNEMMALPKSRFVAIGILEALGVASGMSAAAMLPGPTIPILNQTFLVWQLIFSAIILRRRYLFNQIAGCLLVAVGVVVAVSSVWKFVPRRQLLCRNGASGPCSWITVYLHFFLPLESKLHPDNCLQLQWV